MANCPECNSQVNEDAQKCPYCGRKIIPGDELEKLPQKITAWQKIVIAVSVVILVAIGLTYQGAEDRENAAAQKNFSEPVAEIIKAVSDESGLVKTFGLPQWKLTAETKSAELWITFNNRGFLKGDQAALFGRAVCASLARTYVQKGYMPRSLTVWVTSRADQNKRAVYGKAVFNGNFDTLAWIPGL